MRLSQVDLNLFIVFDAIYTERNLTRASEILCITQPAVSNALSRLRKTFNDPLFVHTPPNMVPTPLADNIIGRVRQALQLLNISVQEGGLFQPVSAEKAFWLSMSDLPEALLLPSFQEILQHEAPGVSIQSYYTQRPDMPRELASGALDLAIEVPLIDEPQLCHRPLIKDRYVCMVRKDHPISSDSLSLQEYLSLGHIHISSRKKGLGHADIALNSLGIQRKIQLRLQHYMIAPLITLRTELALTTPLSLAQQYDAKIFELPFELPELEWHLYWHKSADQDQANIWLRERLLSITSKGEMPSKA